MPAAIAIPAIASVAGAGVSYLGSRSAGKSQEKASNAALGFEREREATRKANYDTAMAAYERRVAAHDTLRQALLGRLGFDIGSAATPPIARTPSLPGSVPTPGGGPVATGPMQQPQTQLMRGGGTIGSMIRPAPEELSSWNDWGRRGLQY